MSEQLVDQHGKMGRRGFLAASLAAAGAAVAGCSRSSGNASVSPGFQSPPTPRPSAPQPRPNAKDPLDLRHMPNGPVRGFPWRYETDPVVPGYNHEAQVYDTRHATVHEGRLSIEAVRSHGGYRSSRIDTMGRWGFTHGKVTAVAKLPHGIGTWPAIWLLPDQRQTPDILTRHGIHDTPDSDFYYAWGGEIDMLETVGWQNKPVNNTVNVHSHRSIVAGGDGAPHVVPVPTGQTDFHEYSLTKRKGVIEFGLDGQTVHGVERQRGDTLADWPFDAYRYYLIANLAMGGTWGGQMSSEFPPHGIDDSQAPWNFEIAELHYQPL